MPVQHSYATHRHRGFDCLCGNVRMAARALTAAYDRALAPAGLSSAQLAVLWCVCSTQPVSMQGIASTLAMEKSTVTRNVEALRAAGWVVVERDARDARGRSVRTTAAGRRTFARAMPLWEAAQAGALEVLGAKSFESLARAARHAARRL